MEKCYYENIFDEILDILKTNLLLYYKYDDKAFLYLKEHCSDKKGKKYQKLDYCQLVFFAEEALAELINCPYLYDFRALE